jgi:hypothetical protein
VGNNWFLLALAILACYRLSRLIALDEGPGGLFLNIRAAGGAYDYGPNGQAVTNFGRGISCPHCVGVWMAFIFAIALFQFDWLLVLYWLAIAGGQSLLQEIGQ